MGHERWSGTQERRFRIACFKRGTAAGRAQSRMYVEGLEFVNVAYYAETEKPWAPNVAGSKLKLAVVICPTGT